MKNFIEVIAKFDLDGRIIPLKVRLNEEEVHMVDRVIDVRPCASLKSGGAGIRYTCTINGILTYLFLEETRWFYEKAE